MNRVAFVTGASSGIGEALARGLSRNGWRVGVIARRFDKLAELVASGGAAAFACADVSDRAQMLKAVAELESTLGPCDLLIANAGIGTPTLIEPLNTPEIERMMRVNYFGVVFAIEAVLPGMLERRCGHVVAVSSLGAYKGLPGESGYCASKAAVNTFMEGLRIQLRGKGVLVTTTCPGFVATPMTDKNRFAMPWIMSADAAAVRIITAISKRRKLHNFPWNTALLTKFSTWLPDWVLARAMRQYNAAPPDASG